MQEQQPTKHLVSEKNKHLQPPLPIYEVEYQKNKTDEWDLRQLLALVRRRTAIIGSVAIAIWAIFWFSALSQKPKYEGKFRLLVEPVTTQTELAGLTASPGTNSNPEGGLDYDTQIQLLQSPKLLAPIVKQIAIRYPDINYDLLSANLKIVRFEETKILEVTYQDLEPQKTQFVLHKLATGYLKYSLQGRQTDLIQGSQFVNLQLPQLQARVNSLQSQLQHFRKQYNFINPEEKEDKLSKQISDIELQRLDTQKQLAATRTLYKILQSSTGAEEALKNALIYQKLRSQLSELDTQIAVESTRFQGDSPTIQALRQKRENLLPLLQQEEKRVLQKKQEEVANQISVLQEQTEKIVQAENSLNQQFKQLPTLARRYTDLQQELKIATDSLNRFLEKRQSLQIETAQKEIPWELVMAPRLPQAPISPNVQRHLFLGAIISLIGGMGAGLLAEKLDNVFHSREDLKEATNLPILGGIPFYKPRKQGTTLGEPTFETTPDGSVVVPNLSNAQGESYLAFLEAFRYLHTNIQLLNSSDTPIHSLVIGSAETGEGKSTIAIDLAQAAAAMGRRVILVDADLRRPEIHNLLSLPNEQGLSNVISTNLTVVEAIQRSPLWDNLYVLTSGYIPPDPSKLLSTKKMQNIMQQLHQQFDLVIYDSPSLLGLADSSLLATHTDGILLVVRMGKTDRSMLMQALDELKLSRAVVLGIVTNCVKNYNLMSNVYYYRSRT